MIIYVRVMTRACANCEQLTASVEQAHARIRELEQRLAECEAERAELHVQLAETTKLCELQQADLDRYKQAYEVSRPNHPERVAQEQLQFAFERVLELLQPPANDEATKVAGTDNDVSDSADNAHQPSGGRRKQKRRHDHGRRNPADFRNLRVVEDQVIPDEVKAANGVGYELIGQDVSCRVAVLAPEWVLYRLVRLKYKAIGVSQPSDDCSSSIEQTTADELPADAALPSSRSADQDVQIVIAPLPLGLWPQVMADASAMAHVIISKYDDLLPLNRQEHICARGGFHLPKSTQCSWLKAANAACAPVVEAMFDDAKKHAHLIAMDATSAPVRPPRIRPGQSPPGLEPHQRPRCETWHIHVFIADRDHVVFRYDRNNDGESITKMLAGYRGKILADAAPVFDVLYREHGMTEHCCWFHCRRPFYRALATEPTRAMEVLSLISKLFEVDRDLRAQQLDLCTFTRLRRERAAPILKLLDDWVKLNRGRVDPRSPLDAAIGYYDNQRVALHRFLEDGRVRLDNNWSEQQLRKLVVGLSNWVFFANETGVAWYTTFRSLIASCLLHQLNPQVYLEQLLRIVPHWPVSRVLELSPKYWRDTVAKLDAHWRSILARPWEPDVILSASVEPPQQQSGVSRERAA